MVAIWVQMCGKLWWQRFARRATRHLECCALHCLWYTRECCVSLSVFSCQSQCADHSDCIWVIVLPLWVNAITRKEASIWKKKKRKKKKELPSSFHVLSRQQTTTQWLLLLWQKNPLFTICLRCQEYIPEFFMNAFETTCGKKLPIEQVLCPIF